VILVLLSFAGTVFVVTTLWLRSLDDAEARDLWKPEDDFQPDADPEAEYRTVAVRRLDEKASSVLIVEAERRGPEAVADLVADATLDLDTRMRAWRLLDTRFRVVTRSKRFDHPAGLALRYVRERDTLGPRRRAERLAKLPPAVAEVGLIRQMALPSNADKRAALQALQPIGTVAGMPWIKGYAVGVDRTLVRETLAIVGRRTQLVGALALVDEEAAVGSLSISEPVGGQLSVDEPA